MQKRVGGLLAAASILTWGGTARAGTVTDDDPGAGGIGYAHTVTLDANDNAAFSDHVGAWSWEDNSLFGPGDPAVGWTHTSRWVALTLSHPTVLTITMARDANVPWPSGTDPDRKASVASMFPSLTLWRNWDNDDGDNHTYNNHGDVDWAEDLAYLDHIDNSTEESITRTWILPAGDYTLALGSNAPANDTDRQGFSIAFTTETIALSDPGEGGIGYARTMIVDRVDAGSFSEHVGAWSWEDDSLFAPGDPTVGWTHTSTWVAMRVLRDTTFTVTMSRDANVPWPSGIDPDRKADTSSMFPSMSIYRGWDNDGGDHHTYNNRGDIDWAEDLSHLDHVDNSTEESITRTWFLPAGDYTLALGSNAPANNTNRQGFSFTYSTQPEIEADPVATPGGVGYFRTLSVADGDSGSFASHVGAWSWEDNALFAPGEQPVGWTHTSNWLALNVEEDAFFTVTMERDADVPWPSGADPDRKADTSSMFPSLTIYRHWDNDGGDHHTYNNQGNVAWAEDLRYLDHVDNATRESITRTWRLPKGQYSMALGSNAPATNPLRQGYRLSYSAAAFAPIFTGDPAPGGISYGRIVTVGSGDSGSFSDHVGAWSWEDNSLFGEGEPPVGWTHTSNWVGVHVTEPLTLDVTMTRDADVPWPSGANPDRKADTSSMFPSLTLWRGWNNGGPDNHTYNNRGDVDWAPDLDYLDHCDNSTEETITRSWTLAPGYYTLALGSNAPATNTNRQGYAFSWSTSAARWVPPMITGQPKGVMTVEGRRVIFEVKAKGPGVEIQWMHDGLPIPGANSMRLVLPSVTEVDGGEYAAEVRNTAGWLMSDPAELAVIVSPVFTPPVLPEFTIGQPGSFAFGEVPYSFYVIRGLPRGLTYDRRTGEIVGRPAASGTFPLTVFLVNAAGKSEPVLVDLVVDAMPAGTTGTFAGVLGRAPLMNDQLGGCLVVTASQSGAFTAVVKLGSATHRAKGMLEVPQEGTSPAGGFSIPRRGRPDVDVEFTIQEDSGVLEGEITDGIDTLPVVARLPISDPADHAGDHTFAYLPDPALAGNESVPQGYSCGRLRVTDKGIASGAVWLADNSVVTFAGPVDVHGQVAVFRTLYRGGGSLLGNFAIEAGTGDLRLSEFDWFKNAVAPKSKSRLYRDGFGPLLLETVGRRYDAALQPLDALGLAANPAGNASITFEDGGAPDPATRLDVVVEVLAGDAKAVNVVSANPGNVSMVVKRSLPFGSARGKRAGLSTGTFALVDSDTTASPAVDRTRKASFRGLIVDDGSGPRVFGYFLLAKMPEAGPPATTVSTAPILSGNFLLEPLAP
ncbi:MAG: hypothetical protein KDM64_00585 [Verrucomicrobiae bacterium]|nr:hypothetical protein [Verrucomicrobiae bacterium]